METLGRIRPESEDPFFREFPADYLQANESQFSIGYVEAESDYSRFDFSFDCPDDRKLARAIQQRVVRLGTWKLLPTEPLR